MGATGMVGVDETLGVTGFGFTNAGVDPVDGCLEASEDCLGVIDCGRTGTDAGGATDG